MRRTVVEWQQEPQETIETLTSLVYLFTTEHCCKRNKLPSVANRKQLVWLGFSIS